MHRRLYLDPEIFAAEMRNIFGRAWVYVGHESEVPHAGDFQTTVIGGQPLVVSRGEDDEVYVLYNRCGHRGALVERADTGHSRGFRCPYHGWTFDNDGTLSGIPMRDGYADFDLDESKHGMARVPRVARYGGFVFASLAAEGPSLLDYLGPAREGIDDLIDRAPDGNVTVGGGAHRYLYEGNWKLQLENICDQYHPPHSHASSVANDGRQFQRRAGDDDGRPQFISAQGGSQVYVGGVETYPHGHSAIGAMRFGDDPNTEIFREYSRRLAARHGPERTREIIRPRRHNTLIYPNLAIQSVSQHIRIINPIAVDRTEVVVKPVLLNGAPEPMLAETIRYLNVTHAAASLIQTDDLEAFERCQRGLTTTGWDWIMFSRGLGEEHRDPKRTVFGPVASEAPMRAQYVAWLDYMSTSSSGTGAEL